MVKRKCEAEGDREGQGEVGLGNNGIDMKVIPTKILQSKKPNESDVFVDEAEKDHPLNLIPYLCNQYYDKGMSGTGGGMAILSNDLIYTTPSGVHKERLSPSDLFILSNDVTRTIVRGNGILSECFELFDVVLKRGFGCVIHTHSIDTVLVTKLFKNEFTVTGMEMIKGLRRLDGKRYKNSETVRVPILENTERECQLVGGLTRCVEEMEEREKRGGDGCCVVLVRGHGVFVWGTDWKDAKTQFECISYLCRAVVQMKMIGLN
jgi:methylthioribulose-1-phosphate dehydratase